PSFLVQPELPQLADQGAAAAEAILADATSALRARLGRDGKIAADALEREQHAVHGLAWLATYATGVRQLSAYCKRLSEKGHLGAAEEALVLIGLGEYLAQIFGGIAMSQTEIVRLSALGTSPE